MNTSAGLTVQRSPFRTVLREFRWQLILTYALFGLEMLGSLARPFFLGLAVDDLMAKRFDGLLLLIGVHLAWMAVATFRHLYDTRTFTAVYTTFIVRLFDRTDVHSDVSQRSAYSTLSQEIVDFLQFDLIFVIEAVYNVLGSLIILMYYDRTVVMICLAALVPIAAFSMVYGKRTARLNVHKHDEMETQVDVIAARDPRAMRGHYGRLRHWQIKLSNQEAWNFGVNEFIVLLVLAGSLLAASLTPDEAMKAGALIALYNYVLRFTTGLDTIPYTIQRLAALRDILQRLDRFDHPTSTANAV